MPNFSTNYNDVYFKWKEARQKLVREIKEIRNRREESKQKKEKPTFTRRNGKPCRA
jgi:hypothetical protein